MKFLRSLPLFLLLMGCDFPDISSTSAVPVASHQIIQQFRQDPGTDFLCGVDTTGLGDGTYDGLDPGVIVVGHRVTGANNRCRVDVLRRNNGYVAFDLSGIGAPRPSGADAPQITGALLTASLARAPDFDGGSIGCRTSLNGVGMLDSIFWLPRREFIPDGPIGLTSPPGVTRVGTLRVDDRVVRINTWWRLANPPLTLEASTPGAATFSLDARAVAALQDMVDRNSLGLRQFGLYLAGTNSGSFSANQTCLDHVSDLRLTVFFRDAP
ncbi:hypothetical protein [Roseovarius nanhaiticus]|uniref:hypothetical protein n=1 Tax=Roseovarius nanhaiticus TaxID=573024 RepID=UPI0024915DA3|nr:hypothetical protein [Roseovarius nanhaiticus]